MTLLTAYVRSLQVRNLSPESIRKARSILSGLERTHHEQLETLTYEQLSAWRDEMSKRITPRSVAANLVWVRSCYRWAVAEGRLDTNPAARLQSPKFPSTLPRPISEDKLQVALANADPRLRALLSLAAFAGLRAHEIASLAWGDVHLDGEEPTIRVMGKGRVEAVVDVSPILVEALSALPYPRRGPVIKRGDNLPGHKSAARVSQVGNDYLHSLGFTDTLHSLRHRFATQVSRHAGLREAQVACRHANPATTALYAKVGRRDVRPSIVHIGQILAS